MHTSNILLSLFSCIVSCIKEKRCSCNFFIIDFMNLKNKNELNPKIAVKLLSEAATKII